MLWSFREPPLVNVREILTDPAFYQGQKVEVEGIVWEMERFAEKSCCYVGENGDSVVKVDLGGGLLQLNMRYRITAVVRKDPKGKVFLEAVNWQREGSAVKRWVVERGMKKR